MKYMSATLFYTSVYCETALIFCPNFKTPSLMQLLAMVQSDLLPCSSVNMVLLLTGHRLPFKLTTQVSRSVQVHCGLVLTSLEICL